MSEAGRQPGYRKRQQLIADGLNDPEAHLDEALRLEHPFVSGNSLKLRHREALASLAEDPGDCNLRRLRTLAEWKTLARSAEVRDLQEFHESVVGKNAKRLGRKPRTGLMSLLTRRYDIADSGIPWL